MVSIESSRRTASVAIVVPVHNDAEWVAKALESCQAQTLRDIEIIVVDDASTDGSAEIIESYQRTDDRIQLIRQATNQSAFQARRRGVEAATAPYVLFMDGDDELNPQAAARAIEVARSEEADVVGFGSKVIRPDSSGGGRYESSMQPKHTELIGEEILASIFPIGVTAQGQLWRYLFARNLLAEAYESLSKDLILRRVNDLPIAFLVLMRARKYVSIPDVLYRYFFRRGASGHQVQELGDYLFTASAIDSIEAIAETVAAESDTRGEDPALLAIYESTRLSVIGRVLEYVYDTKQESLRTETLGLLIERVGGFALALACADYCAKALPMLTALAPSARVRGGRSKHVVLRTGNLKTGGVQGVLIAQAGYLARAGYRVSILVDSTAGSAYALPEGAQLMRIEGESRGQRVAWFIDYCLREDVQAVVDHHILYNERWPFFALAAAESGIPMIGWLHNFALRPIMDGNERLSFLGRYLPLLVNVVVLSAADVAYWKLRGLENVVYLPNPASPLLETLGHRGTPRRPPEETIELIWWGRLQQSTKQVREFLRIAADLRAQGVDFRITLVGPDGPDLSARELLEEASRLDLQDHFDFKGEVHGEDLVRAVEHAHVFLNTSAIEGYPLSLVEAQAFGLPIVMYELPWLAFLANNGGVLSVEQGHKGAAAAAISALRDPETYERFSVGALESARRVTAHNFESLYVDLVNGELPVEYSAEPTLEDMRLLIGQHVIFVERLVRRERRAFERVEQEVRNQRKKVRRLEGEFRDARADGLGQRKKAQRLARELREVQDGRFISKLKGLARRVRSKLRG